MSYEINPIEVVSYLENDSIKLPRFQRKETWKGKQNFELAISIYKNYPVGVIIINEAKGIDWLLDGRQRRNALLEVRNNPITLYSWAKKYLKLVNGDSMQEVRNKFWASVNEFLESGDKDDEIKEVDLDQVSVEEKSFDKDEQRSGLQTLLEQILMVHPLKKGKSGWEDIFNYGDYFQKIQYLNDNGEVDPEKLTIFIRSFVKNKEEKELRSREKFCNFYENHYVEQDEGKSVGKFEEYVSRNWTPIEKALHVVKKMDKVMKSAKIAEIRLKNASSLDALNIFSTINSGGTKLTAEELLSAKPFWNRRLENVDSDTKRLADAFYSKMEISVDNRYVLWDLGATLIERVDENSLIFSHNKKTDSVSVDRISLGFKLLSSIECNGMSNKSVNELEKITNLQDKVLEIVDELNDLFGLLYDYSLFSDFLDWKKPIQTLIGNAPALEFVTLVYRKWKDSDMPKRRNKQKLQEVRSFAADLLDRLFYEYTSSQWKGSGDSKLAKDLKSTQVKKSTSSQEWAQLIAELIKTAGKVESIKTVTPLLYYCQILAGNRPNRVDQKFDVDHIVPQVKFKGNEHINEMLKDSLGNLSLLPAESNKKKNDKLVNEIHDDQVIKDISLYEGIPKEEYEKYSDISNINEILNERYKKIEDTFRRERETVLSN